MTTATGVPVAGTRMIADAAIRLGCPLTDASGVPVAPEVAAWRGVAVTASETARPTERACLDGATMDVREVVRYRVAGWP